jgi:hypothetical protein
VEDKQGQLSSVYPAPHREGWFPLTDQRFPDRRKSDRLQRKTVIGMEEITHLLTYWVTSLGQDCILGDLIYEL